MESKAQFGRGSSLFVAPTALVLLGAGTLLALRLGSGLMAGMCLFFLLLGLGARWWGTRAIRGVSIRIECEKPRLFPGQKTQISYEIENNKLLPLIWLELSQNGAEQDCLVPDDDFERYFPPGSAAQDEPIPFLRQSFSFVGSWQTLRLESTWTAARRGLYPIDRLVARSGDGFGLVQEERPLPADRLPVLAVYPRQVEVDLSLFLRPQWDCAAGGRGWMEDNTVLRGSREYQNGDNWKHINWRMAAREQGLPVNQYESIQPQGMRFILDGESFCTPSGDSASLEPVLEVLASILAGLSGMGIVCSLTLPQSRRFDPVTISGEEGSGIGDLLFHLAGYRCLAIPDPSVSSQSGQPVLLPSRFPSDAVPQTGSVFLLTRSGAQLPTRLMAGMDPGRLCVLCLEDCEVPERMGFRCVSLNSLRKGGGAA